MSGTSGMEWKARSRLWEGFRPDEPDDPRNPAKTHQPPPPVHLASGSAVVTTLFFGPSLKPNIHSRDTRAIAASFAVTNLILGLNLVTGVLLARSLGPHNRGELAAILLWPSLLTSLGGLGIADALTYHAARRTNTLGTVIGTSLLVALVQSVVLGVVAILVVPPVLSARGIEPSGVVYLSFLYIPFFFLADYLIWAVAGAQRLSWFPALRLSIALFTATLLLAIWLIGDLSVGSALLVYPAAFALSALAASAVIIRGGGWRLGYSGKLARALLAFGSRSQLSTASTVLNQRLDQVVIALFLTPAVLGTYVVAVAISSLPAAAGGAMAYVVFPRVSALPAGKVRADMARQSLQLTLFASLALAVVLIGTLQWLVGLLVGSAYDAAVNVARVLVVASVFLSMNSTLTALLKAVGQPLQAGLGGALALVVTIAGLILLVPLYGIMGAAVVSLAAYAVSAAFLLHRAARELEMSMSTLLFSPAFGGSTSVLVGQGGGGKVELTARRNVNWWKRRP